MGKIRLACRFCDSHEYDAVNLVPTDWFAVEEVQNYEASLRQVTRIVNDITIVEWYTHLGVCPDCYETEIRQPIAG